MTKCRIFIFPLSISTKHYASFDRMDALNMLLHLFSAVDSPTLPPPRQRLTKSRRTTLASSTPAEVKKMSKTASTSSDMESAESDSGAKNRRQTSGRHGNEAASAVSMTTTAVSPVDRCASFFNLFCHLPCCRIFIMFCSDMNADFHSITSITFSLTNRTHSSLRNLETENISTFWKTKIF